MVPSLRVSSMVESSMAVTGVAETGFLTSLIVKESWVPLGTVAVKTFLRVKVCVV